MAELILSEKDWLMDSGHSEREYRIEVGKRFKRTRKALGYKKRPDLARIFVEDESDIAGLADRIRQWEDGKALVPPFFARHLRLAHGVTHDWIYEGDASGLPMRVAEALRETSRQDTTQSA